LRNRILEDKNMIILCESKRPTIQENARVNPSRWTSRLKNLSIFMYGFLLRIEREGFWETNDAPRTYRDINVVTHNNGSEI
jgi:hypothetical protein